MLARLIGYRNDAMSPKDLERCASTCRLIISAGGGSCEGDMGREVLVGDVADSRLTTTGICAVRITVTSDTKGVGRCVAQVDTKHNGNSTNTNPNDSAAWYVLTPPLAGEALIQLTHDPLVFRIISQQGNDRARVNGIEAISRADHEIKMMRAALRDNQTMLTELGTVMAANHSLKLELLHRMRSMEVERKRLMSDASAGRAKIEDVWRLEFEKIVFVDYVPKLRDLRKKHADAKLKKTKGV